MLVLFEVNPINTLVTQIYVRCIDSEEGDMIFSLEEDQEFNNAQMLRNARPKSPVRPTRQSTHVSFESNQCFKCNTCNQGIFSLIQKYWSFKM